MFLSTLPQSFFISLSIFLEVSLSAPSPEVAQGYLLPLLPENSLPSPPTPGLVRSWETAQTSSSYALCP